MRGGSPEPYDIATWRQAAACAGADLDLFFPVGPTDTTAMAAARAKEMCAGCPVRRACLSFALSTRQEFGIWGGFDEQERRRMARKARAKARESARSFVSSPHRD
jgi:WhiB family redox-sensing transcriptional regulator